MTRTILALTLLALAGLAPPSDAQTVRGERLQLSTGPCTLRSGSGAPSTSLGVVCDTYFRTDSPYTVYVKTGGSTWSEIYRAGGTDVAVADGGTGVSSWTTGHLVYASGTTTLAGTATPSVTSLTATGAVQGATLAGTTSVTTPTLTASANLTLSPTGDIVISPGGNDVLPGLGYTHNIGARTNKFLSLHAGELQVDTLVANSTMATIGGRILVGPTTELTSDLSSGATSMSVKHNQMANGDRVLLEANGALEWMAITSGPSGSGPYTYSITRDLDGTGANAWVSGDAVFNTGQTGSGYMDLFSLGSSVFVGHSGIFNFDAALNAYSTNYFETDVWPPFGDAANNTVNDAIYWGSPVTYGVLSAYAITPVVSSSTLVWEFWNGSAWTSFTPTGAGFGSVGPGAVTLGTLTGWATTAVNGITAYWIRLRISVVGGGTTAGVWRQTRRGPQQWGPTIIGNQRTASTYNEIYPRWAIGNLSGSYGYSATTFGAAFGSETGANITIDATNGIRFRNSSTTTLSMSNDELNLQNTGVIKSGSATALDTGTGIWLAANAGTPQLRIGNPSGDRVRWDGTNLSIVSTNLTINSSGVTISPSTAYANDRAYSFTVATGQLGVYGNENTGSGNRSLRMYSDWTGTGNKTVMTQILANNTPSSGGSVQTASVSATVNSDATTSVSASSTNGAIVLTSNEGIRFLTNGGGISQRFYIYTDNTAAASPNIRSDGTYTVLNASTGSTIYIGQDSNANVQLTAGGGTTTVNTGLVLNGLATCTLQVNGAGAVGCVSDSAAKRDIQSWSPGLDAIAQLRPVSYRWKEGDQAPAVGFLAQEVGDVIPEAVRRQEWGGGMLTLDDRAILAALVNAVKELRDEQRQRR